MKKLLTVLLALIFALSAVAETDVAALIQENAALKEQLAAYSDPTVIAVFDGGTVKFEEVFNEYLSRCEIYSMFYDVDLTNEPDLSRQVQKEIVDSFIEEKLIEAYAAAQNKELVTDADKVQARADAEEYYSLLYEETYQFYISEGYNSEEAEKLTVSELDENECDVDSLYQSYLEEIRQNAINALLVGDVELSEEAVQEVYNDLLQSDMDYYSTYPEDYSYTALYDETPVVWIPEGYRLVRMLLVPFSDAALTEYDELIMQYYTAETESEYVLLEQKIDELYLKLEAEAANVEARFNAGESFAQMLNDYPYAQTLMPELGSSDGFPVSADSWIYDDELLKTAMALETPGDVSGRVKTDCGIAYLEYIGDIQSGAVPFEDVEEQVTAIAMDEAVYERYCEAVEELIANANVTYFLDRLN